MEEAQRLHLDERRDRAYDMRAAMADKDGFAEHVNGLKPKR